MSFHLHPGSAPCPCWVLGALLHPACRWGLKAAFWRHSSAKVLQLINTSARNWKNCMHTAIRTYLYAFRMLCFNKIKKYGFLCCLSWGNKHQGTRSAALLLALCARDVWAANWQGCTGRRDRDGFPFSWGICSALYNLELYKTYYSCKGTFKQSILVLLEASWAWRDKGTSKLCV